MLSVVILTKNQDKLLKACLESVKWADELVVVDDDSTNTVLDIAKQYTDKIFTHKLTNFADQRNYAMSLTKCDWVLFIDPDERVTKQLREEITSVLYANHTAAAYAIPRRNFFLGEEQKYVGGWPDHVIRLMKKEKFKTWHGALHENPVFDGEVGHLREPFIHLTHMDITSMTHKTLQWSYLEAKLRLNTNHPPMSAWRFLRVVKTTFFEWYILKGGWRSTIGTIEAIFQTFSVFITYVRLWEMQQNPSLQEKYEKIDTNLLESDFAKV